MGTQRRSVAVIGGGAAGFFAALSAAEAGAEVCLLERSPQCLAKVKVSGGGRCNATHRFEGMAAFLKQYPRGAKSLARTFAQFGPLEAVDWFARRGVPLHTEADGRMFPTTNQSQTIIDCLLSEADRLGVSVLLKHGLASLSPSGGGWALALANGQTLQADAVVVATGGSPKREGLAWLEGLGHRIVPPVPSLFTFNLPGDPIRGLMGVSVPRAKVRLSGGKMEQEGPLLVTHWGMSGPAVLRLSAFGARELADCGYRFEFQVCWEAGWKEDPLREMLLQAKETQGAKQAGNLRLGELPQRLWLFLLEKAGIPAEAPLRELPNKSLNRLAQLLTRDVYRAEGKTTFKEEFVTCGGVDLRDVDFGTMESRACPGLYFAGEVLDVDGVTGGFNFQAAWSTGYVAGRSAAGQ